MLHCDQGATVCLHTLFTWLGKHFAALAQRLHHMQFLSLLTRFISVFQECGLHVLHRWTPLHKRYECRTFSVLLLSSHLHLTDTSNDNICRWEANSTTIRR